MSTFLATSLIWISSAVALNMTFLQSDFVFTFERAEVVSYDPKYYSDVVVKTYKFNRTQAVTNITFKVKIRTGNQQYKIEIQAYKFMSNEYRDFPIRFSYSFCEALRKNDFGIRDAAFKCGNFSSAGCPPKRGTYHICNFFLDGGNFPPYVPEGSYMGDVKWFDGPKELAFARGYGNIKYKNFWQH